MVAAHEDTSWITELKEYILKGTLPADDTGAERVAGQAKVYIIHDGKLYRKRPNGVSLRCISKEEGELLLKDVHARECGHHSSARMLVGKAYRQGFFWPSALQDATDLVKTCEACQLYAKQIHQPVQELHTIPLSWPFAVWGLDILGPFPRAVGGYRFLFVAIDKFTKLLEVEAV